MVPSRRHHGGYDNIQQLSFGTQLSHISQFHSLLSLQLSELSNENSISKLKKEIKSWYRLSWVERETWNLMVNFFLIQEFKLIKSCYIYHLVGKVCTHVCLISYWYAYFPSKQRISWLKPLKNKLSYQITWHICLSLLERTWNFIYGRFKAESAIQIMSALISC